MGTRPLELFHLFGELNNLAGIGPRDQTQGIEEIVGGV